MLVGCLKEQGGIILTEAITRQTGSNPFVPYNIKPVSNPYSEEEKSRKGAPSAQQDKGLVQSASVPPSECLGQWETHMASKTRKRSLTPEEKGQLRDVAWSMKDSVLSGLEKDGPFRDRVRSHVLIDRHWKLLSKDCCRRDPMMPEVLHDGYAYVKIIIEYCLVLCGIEELPEKTRDFALKALFWVFLVGGHSYVRESSSSEA